MSLTPFGIRWQYSKPTTSSPPQHAPGRSGREPRRSIGGPMTPTPTRPQAHAEPRRFVRHLGGSTLRRLRSDSCLGLSIVIGWARIRSRRGMASGRNSDLPGELRHADEPPRRRRSARRHAAGDRPGRCPGPALRGDVRPRHRPPLRRRGPLPAPGPHGLRLRRHRAGGAGRPEPGPPPRRPGCLRAGLPACPPGLVLPPALGRRPGDRPVLRPHRLRRLPQRRHVGRQRGGDAGGDRRGVLPRPAPRARDVRTSPGRGDAPGRSGDRGCPLRGRDGRRLCPCIPSGRRHRSCLAEARRVVRACRTGAAIDRAMELGRARGHHPERRPRRAGRRGTSSPRWHSPPSASCGTGTTRCGP